MARSNGLRRTSQSVAAACSSIIHAQRTCRGSAPDRPPRGKNIQRPTAYPGAQGRLHGEATPLLPEGVPGALGSRPLPVRVITSNVEGNPKIGNTWAQPPCSRGVG